jgi:hypothetical protein
LDIQVGKYFRKLRSSYWVLIKKRLLTLLIWSFLVLMSGCKEDRQNQLLSTTKEYDTTTEASDLWSKVGGIPDSSASDGIKPMSYTDNGDGTITDNVTKLIWQKMATSYYPTHADAIDYCKNLQLAGFSDWQLPDVRSLVTILDLSRENPAINGSYFLNTKSENTVAMAGWAVNFADGSVVKVEIGFARCVRSAW